MPPIALHVSHNAPGTLLEKLTFRALAGHETGVLRRSDDFRHSPARVGALHVTSATAADTED